jgi:hypothetical protein
LRPTFSVFFISHSKQSRYFLSRLEIPSAMQCVNTARSQGSLPVCASALNGAARAPHGLYPARVHKEDASVRCSKEKHANDQEAKKIVQHPAPIAAMRGAAGGVATCGAAQRIDATLAGAVSAATSKSGYFFTFIGATATPAVGACTGFKTYTIVGVLATVGQSGQSGFFDEQSGLIRCTTAGAAPMIASPPLQ